MFGRLMRLDKVRRLLAAIVVCLAVLEAGRRYLSMPSCLSHIDRFIKRLRRLTRDGDLTYKDLRVAAIHGACDCTNPTQPIVMRSDGGSEEAGVILSLLYLFGIRTESGLKDAEGMLNASRGFSDMIYPLIPPRTLDRVPEGMQSKLQQFHSINRAWSGKWWEWLKFGRSETYVSPYSNRLFGLQQGSNCHLFAVAATISAFTGQYVDATAVLWGLGPDYIFENLARNATTGSYLRGLRRLGEWIGADAEGLTFEELKEAFEKSHRSAYVGVSTSKEFDDTWWKTSWDGDCRPQGREGHALALVGIRRTDGRVWLLLADARGNRPRVEMTLDYLGKCGGFFFFMTKAFPNATRWAGAPAVFYEY